MLGMRHHFTCLFEEPPRLPRRSGWKTWIKGIKERFSRNESIWHQRVGTVRNLSVVLPALIILLTAGSCAIEYMGLPATLQRQLSELREDTEQGRVLHRPSVVELTTSTEAETTTYGELRQQEQPAERQPGNTGAESRRDGQREVGSETLGEEGQVDGGVEHPEDFAQDVDAENMNDASEQRQIEPDALDSVREELPRVNAAAVDRRLDERQPRLEAAEEELPRVNRDPSLIGTIGDAQVYQEPPPGERTYGEIVRFQVDVPEPTKRVYSWRTQCEGDTVRVAEHGDSTSYFYRISVEPALLPTDCRVFLEYEGRTVSYSVRIQ